MKKWYRVHFVSQPCEISEEIIAENMEEAQAKAQKIYEELIRQRRGFFRRTVEELFEVKKGDEDEEGSETRSGKAIQ